MTKRKEYIMGSSDEEDETDASIAAAGSSIASTQLKPQVESIFAEVEQSLPSIDFELSDVGSDNEEPIFHRNLKADLDDDKDLDTSEIDGYLESDNNKCDSDSSVNASVEDNKLKKNKLISEPVFDNDIALKRQLESSSSSSPIKKNNASTETVISSLDMNKPTPMQQNWVTNSTDTSEVTFGGSESNKIVHSKSDPVLTVSQREVTVQDDTENINWNEYKKKERKIKKKKRQEENRQMDREVACSFLSPTAPELPVPDFDNIDIDDLLENINSDNRYASINVGSLSSNRHRSSQNGSGEPGSKSSPTEESGTLIERLAALSMTQSGEDLKNIDPRTGAQLIDNSTHGSVDIYSLPNNDTAAIGVQETKTASCGTSTNDMSAPKIMYPRARAPPKTSEPETVFIDLRNFEEKKRQEKQKIERVQQILRIQQDSSSESSDSENDNELWFERRRRMKQLTTSVGVSTKQPPSRIGTNERMTTHKTPNRVINLSKPKEAKAKPEKKESDATGGSGEPACHAQAEAELKRQTQLEEARKLREKQESERQSRIRLAQRLEVLRPTLSTSTRQPAAEATPFIYDVESSYEPSSKTLPSVLSSDNESLLLTIHLMSSGEIVLHRGKSNKSVDTGIGLSATYTTLLTWLLSLVPDKFDYLESADKSAQGQPVLEVPFHVIGLQQVWMNEQLCLVVAITPPPGFDSRYIPSKIKKSKMRDEIKDSTPFHQYLIKYLSTNTLHTVCPWMQDLVSMEVPCAQKSSQSDYVYRPPLPNITSKPLSTFIQVNPDHLAAEKVFNLPIGFFWHTVDNEEHSYEQNLKDGLIEYDTQNTMSLVYKKIFHDPRSMMGIFNRVLQEGLDLSGVRLLYPTAELLSLPKPHDNVHAQTDLHVLNNIGPLLAIALRGTFARTIWLDAVGPSDPNLARRTDPNSLCALYGGTSRDECLLFCPRNPMRVQSELSRWFGGRVPPGGVIDVGTPQPRKEKLRSSSPKGRKSKKAIQTEEEEIPTKRPPAALVATIKSEIFLVISPLISYRCMGIIMSSCQRRGYQIRGIRRIKLNHKKANTLGISGASLTTFCPGVSSSTEHLPEETEQGKQLRQIQACSPVCVLLLEKENAAHNTASLIESCMVQMTLQGIMGEVQSKTSLPLLSSHLFHAIPYCDSVLASLGGDFSKCPDRELQVLPGYVTPYFHSNPEIEQMVVLILMGHDFLKNCGLFIAQLMNLIPYNKSKSSCLFPDGFELLGMKWLPHLSASQAKEVTPVEVGDKKWKESIQNLTTDPAIVLLLRGIDAFSRLQSVIQNSSPRNMENSVDKIMSYSAEDTYMFTTLFFSDKELYPDTEARKLLRYLPHSRFMDSQLIDDSQFLKQYLLPGGLQESIFDTMKSGPRLITSILIIKPTAVQKYLHKIMKKLVQEGFLIVGYRLAMLTEDNVLPIVPKYVDEDEEISKHVKYLTSGPVLCLCVQRENAVKKLLDILGPEDPHSARRFSQFLWRGVFGLSTIANGFHGSLNYQSAVSEIKHFFPDGICCQPTEDLQEDKIICPATDSIIDLKYYKNREVVEDEMAQANQSVLSRTLNLIQTTCIVLLPPLFQSVHKVFRFGVAEIFDGLFSHSFSLVGGRMVSMTKNQAEQFLHVIDAGSFQKVPSLTCGPCLVLALQRDNAVITFDTLLGGPLPSESVIGRYGDFIIRPSGTKQANNMLAFFFDHLMPGSHLKINAKTKQEK